MNCRNSTLLASLPGLALLCAGCALGPHPADNTTSRAAAPVSSPSTGTAALAPLTTPTSPAINAAASPIPPVEYAAILTEIQQLGACDPAAQNALLEDMKRTDPTLWPQLVQTFRSSVAYHRQLEERRIAAIQPVANPVATAPSQSPIRQAAYSDGRELSPGAVLTQSFPGAAEGAVAPLSPAAEFASAYPDTHLPEVSLVKANRAEPLIAPTAPAPVDWHDQLQATIRTLEAKLASDSQARSEPPSATDQATLRMLYLSAGWRDDATRPLDGPPDRDRSFWREELTGLATLLDDRRIGDAGRRAAEARPHLQTAENMLAASAPLAVRNPAFCTEVTSFGVIKPFANYQFKPGQELLLYAELENFASEPTEKGYHTAMHSSYQILDSRGAKVAEQDYAITEENCRNPRRDYFLRYFVYLPKQIPSGNYTLQLTIEDTLGRKAGQSTVPFEIVAAN